VLTEGWWARLRGTEPGSTGATLVAVMSEEFPPRTVVDLPGTQRPSGWRIAVRSDADGRVRAIETGLPHAPLLWYVEVPEPDAAPAATTLIAFSDDRHPEGALLGAAEAQADGVSSADQVAAFRWWPGTGLVHQVFVVPRHRRRGVGLKLGHVAFGLQRARGLPGLHGDGYRTRLGEEFRKGLPSYGAWRVAPWSHEVPPMDVPA
jgi:GNAT superfamily N-acetyltransferase